MKVQSLFSGVYLGAGAGVCRGLWVMRTWTGGVGATEGLEGTVVMVTVLEKLVVGGVFDGC